MTKIILSANLLTWFKVSYIQDLTECPQCHNSSNYLHEYGTSKSFSIRLSTKQETKTRSC